MGGYGSGQFSHRARVEAQLSLPVGHFAKARQGAISIYRWGTRNNPDCGSVSFEVLVGGVLFNWRSSRGGESWANRCRASFTWTEPHLGGRRAWWECPVCGRRCGVLYVRAHGLECRTCADLRYTSSGECPMDRAARRRANLDKRLGATHPSFSVVGGDEPPPPRPKGMHRTTYERLCAERDRAAQLADALWLEGAVATLDRIDPGWRARRWG